MAYEFKSFNTASVLIQLQMEDMENMDLMFQYSFCSYSTQNTLALLPAMRSFNTASVLIQRKHVGRHGQRDFVSIQLLFLFNLGKTVPGDFSSGFNTASVLIQEKWH